MNLQVLKDSDAVTVVTIPNQDYLDQRLLEVDRGSLSIEDVLADMIAADAVTLRDLFALSTHPFMNLTSRRYEAFYVFNTASIEEVTAWLIDKLELHRYVSGR